MYSFFIFRLVSQHMSSEKIHKHNLMSILIGWVMHKLTYILVCLILYVVLIFFSNSIFWILLRKKWRKIKIYGGLYSKTFFSLITYIIHMPKMEVWQPHASIKKQKITICKVKDYNYFITSPTQLWRYC